MNTSHWGVHATNYLPLNVPNAALSSPRHKKMWHSRHAPVNTSAVPSRRQYSGPVMRCPPVPSPQASLLPPPLPSWEKIHWALPPRPVKKYCCTYRPVLPWEK